MSFLNRVDRPRLKIRFWHPEGVWSRAAAPSHRKESVKGVWASDQDASWAPPVGSFIQAGTTSRRPHGGPRTHWRDMCHLSWDCCGIPRVELKNCRRDGSLGHLAESANTSPLCTIFILSLPYSVNVSFVDHLSHGGCGSASCWL